MKIAVLSRTAPVRGRGVPIPDIAADEVLVRIAACGVCASELDMWEGRGRPPFPLYPGHEVSGTVVEAGPQVAGIAAANPSGSG